jgi:hypothetical protein
VYDHTRLDWRVPQQEWTHFREFVEDEHGSISGYLGREAEKAMREYIDMDGYGEIEERVNQLVQAAGRTTQSSLKNKKGKLEGGEKTRVTVQVEEDIKNEFRRFVSDSEHTLGVEFATAIRAYRDGGRPARLESKLDRILDDVTDILGELDTTADESGSLSAKQRKVIAICDRLDKSFHDDELVEAIDEIAGRSDRASQPTREEYRDVVTNRLNVEPHPNTDDLLWIPAEEAKQYAGEGVPRVCRQRVSTLDRSERVERIRLAVGCEAAKRTNGEYAESVTTIRKQVLDSEVSRPTAAAMIRDAANVEGFEVVDSPEVTLRVYLGIVKEDEPELQEDVLEYANADSDGLLSSSVDAKVTDYGGGSWKSEDSVDPDVLFARPDGG